MSNRLLLQPRGDICMVKLEALPTASVAALPIDRISLPRMCAGYVVFRRFSLCAESVANCLASQKISILTLGAHRRPWASHVPRQLREYLKYVLLQVI
jgi:hypothetical protein